MTMAGSALIPQNHLNMYPGNLKYHQNGPLHEHYPRTRISFDFLDHDDGHATLLPRLRRSDYTFNHGLCPAPTTGLSKG